jgi:hypothetical protein
MPDRPHQHIVSDLCRFRLEQRDAMLSSAFCAVPAVGFVSSTTPSSSRSAFPIVSRYSLKIEGASPSSPFPSQSSSA